MVRSLMEIYLARDGKYLGANDLALAILGYTADEVVALPQGGLSRTDPEVVRKVWASFVAGQIEMPGDRPGEMVTKDHRVLPVIFMGVAEDRPDGSYTSRMRQVGTSVVLNRPQFLFLLLAEWRSAESLLATLAPDDPGRDELEQRLADFAAVYQAEARGKGASPASLTNAHFEQARVEPLLATEEALTGTAT